MTESETLNITTDEFHTRLLQLLMGEVLELKFKVAKLEGASTDDIADMTVSHLKKFVEVFPAENQEQLHRMTADMLSEMAKTGKAPE